ncbi:MAG: hypothetical protein M3277_03595 [Actinomycetota bacterium]|nr:hypothetical protein [Actinomycetota bacterium]
MPPDSIVNLVVTSVIMGGLGALFWARLNRLEDELARIRSSMTTKDDFNTLREDLREMRGDMGGMREEMAVMRSDLTHVALAVGANRPKPAEGEKR